MNRKEVGELLTLASELDRKANYLSGMLSTRQDAVTRLETTLEVSKKEQMLLDKVKAVLSHLMESTSHKDLQGMDALVTYGLTTVYPEKQLEFKSELVDSGKKVTVEMSTLRSGSKASKDQHGSVSVLESLIIRVLSILKLRGARFLIADEPFAAIGSDHINNVGTLLEELARRLDMDILLVTHNPGVSDACMFRASLASGNQLKLSKVGGSEKSGAVEAEVAPAESGDPVPTPVVPADAEISPAKKARKPATKKKVVVI